MKGQCYTVRIRFICPIQLFSRGFARGGILLQERFLTFSVAGILAVHVDVRALVAFIKITIIFTSSVCYAYFI
jgi:hypothetical protein